MSQFKNLVFEGGGVRGIAYAGAIKVLGEKDTLRSLVSGWEDIGGGNHGRAIGPWCRMGRYSGNRWRNRFSKVYG